MRNVVRTVAAVAGVASLALVAGCGGGDGGNGTDDAASSKLQSIIKQAEGMTNDELFKKAIEESDGKTMYGIGNSSRGADAATEFIAALQEIDPSYSGKIEWSQPKNNSIFTVLNADVNSSSHQYSMTLIQDANQIQTKMIDTGVLLNFVPKDWKDAKGVNADVDSTPLLTLQTLSKVFQYNNLAGTSYGNVWDFVAEGESPMFMGVNSEPVGKNFLYMLTEDTYATTLKDAFDKLDAGQQAAFKPTVDAMADEAKSLGLEGDNAKYALAWIKLWASQYNEQTDDGPIEQQLVTTSAKGATGLLVYSSSAPSRSRRRPRSRTWTSPRTRTATRARAASATSTTSRSRRRRRSRGRPWRSSPSWSRTSRLRRLGQGHRRVLGQPEHQPGPHAGRRRRRQGRVPRDGRQGPRLVGVRRRWPPRPRGRAVPREGGSGHERLDRHDRRFAVSDPAHTALGPRCTVSPRPGIDYVS